MTKMVYPYQNFNTALAWSGRAADALALGDGVLANPTVDAQLPRAGSPEVLGAFHHKKGSTVVYADSAKAMLGKSYKRQEAMGDVRAMSARRMLGKSAAMQESMGYVTTETGMGCACDAKPMGSIPVLSTIDTALRPTFGTATTAVVVAGLGGLAYVAYKALKKRR